MNRLTKDLHNQYNDYWYRKDLEQVCDKEQIVLTKLGMLEDIEEELGIDFITMFRALKYGIYCFTSQKRLTHNYVRLVSNDIGVGVRDKVSYSFMAIFGEQILLFEDYGKTWALTSEELEK